MPAIQGHSTCLWFTIALLGVTAQVEALQPTVNQRAVGSSRGRSAERRNAPSSRTPSSGGVGTATTTRVPAANGNAGSILDDGARMILRKPNQQPFNATAPLRVPDQPVAAAAARVAAHRLSSGGSGADGAAPGSAAAAQKPAAAVRRRSASVERQPVKAPVAADLQHQQQQAVAPAGAAPGRMQQRLQEEALQLRQEVVEDSTRVRALQEKRASGGEPTQCFQ